MNLPNIKDEFTHLVDQLHFQMTTFQNTHEVRVVEIWSNHIQSTDIYLTKQNLLQMLEAIEQYEIEQLFEDKPPIVDKIKEINFDLTDQEWEMCFGDDTK